MAGGSGWVRAAFTSPPSLAAGTGYVAAVYYSGIDAWYSYDHDWWDTGPGASGITSGILTAPGNSGSANGQQVFRSSPPLGFPESSFEATAYWMDVEVTTPGPAGAGLLMSCFP